MRKYLLSLLLFMLIVPVLAQDEADCPQQIIFSSNMTGDFEIYAIDLPADGEIAAEATRLTESEGTDTWPRWSPNGEMIAYQNGDNDIVILDAEGNLFQTLEHPETGDFVPTWTHNSNGVAFISTNGVEPSLVLRCSGCEKVTLHQTCNWILIWRLMMFASIFLIGYMLSLTMV